MTNSSFTGYARGEGFRPYKAPYDFLTRQQEQDAEIIRNLKENKQEFDRRASKAESDMARVFQREEQNLAENQRIEDLYFANRVKAFEAKARSDIENIKITAGNEKQKFESRQALAKFAPSLFEEAIKVKKGIDEKRLEVATNEAIARIMPGMDEAYSEQVQRLREQHDGTNALADAMQASGLPQRAVTYIRRGSNLTKYVELQQAAKNLKAIYPTELQRRILETVKDPNDPHQVAFATEKIQIDLLKEHGLYGYNADFLHDLYLTMKSHRNQSILKSEYDRDLKFEQRETEILRDAVFADLNPVTLNDYVKGLGTYRAENGAYRSQEQVLATLFKEFAENPQAFPLEKIQEALKGVDDGTGQSLYSRVENTARYAEFIRQYSSKVVNDSRIQQNLDKVEERNAQVQAKEFLNSEQWQGDYESVKQLIQTFEAKGYDSSFLKPYIDKSNEVRANTVQQEVILDNLLASGKAGLKDLEGMSLSTELKQKYTPLFRESGKNRDIIGGESELKGVFSAALRTNLKETSKEVSIEGLSVAADKALDMFYKDFQQRRKALGSNITNPDAVRQAAETSRDYIRKQILDGSGDFRVASFADNRANNQAYYPAFTPKSKVTPDGKREIGPIIPPTDFRNLQVDPRSVTIATPLELETINRQIEQGIPVAIPDKYYEMYRTHNKTFKSPADVLNNQLKQAGYSTQLGPGIQEQLRDQTDDVNLRKLINKINSPTRLGMATQLLSGGTRNPAYMSPRVSAMYGDLKFVLDTIASVESGAAGYNAVNQGGSNSGRTVLGFSGDFRKMPQHGGRALTDLNVGEVLDLLSGYDDYQRYPTFESWSSAGKLHAVGRYQFIGNTLPGLVQRSGISLNAKFNAATQDRLALQLFKERGYSPWVGVVDNIPSSTKQRLDSIRRSING